MEPDFLNKPDDKRRAFPKNAGRHQRSCEPLSVPVFIAFQQKFMHLKELMPPHLQFKIAHYLFFERLVGSIGNIFLFVIGYIDSC